MPDESRLLEMVVRWQELRQTGQSVSAEQLCCDCPELLPALEKRLRALGTMDRVLETADADQANASRVPGTYCSTRETVPVEQGGLSQPAGEFFPEVPGFDILRELGRGGMGVVYKARQSALKRLVALKMLKAGRHAAPAERTRFKVEVEAIARLQHPNLVQVFEVGEYEGRPFYSMEYVDGGNLQDRTAFRPQPQLEAAAMVEVLARAMHAAHQRGVIHRDLKPANVLLTAEGTPKISDFGLAKRMDVASELTLSQHVLGTPSYMAPEQAAGQSKQVGPGADVYALGAILYQMLTGRPPFQGEGVMDLIRQLAEDDPVPPRRLQANVPVDLETICLKCLNKSPTQRYSSAEALADDLQRFRSHEPVLARPTSRWQRLAKWARRRPASASLIIVSGLALGVLLAGGWWFTQRLATELEKADLSRREALAGKQELEQALVRQVAAGLDGDLRQLEMVPQAMAALLARREDWKVEQLEAWTRSLVAKDKRIFGICVAFEPWQFAAARKDYCLYVYEKPDGLSTKQLLPPNYPSPFYRDRDWYKAPQTAKRASWSEPYMGQRADNTPIVSYAVPFDRAGIFSGVVAADLSMEYLRELHHQLQSVHLGPNSYSFVLSPKGTFLYHPNPIHEFPAAASSLDRVHAAPDFLALVRRMQQKETGQGQATDFNSGRPASFLFARIPSTGWYFVVVQSAPVQEQASSS